jgi:hypothetical protein
MAKVNKTNPNLRNNFGIMIKTDQLIDDDLFDTDLMPSESDFRPELYSLETASSAVEFHKLLGDLVQYVPQFNESELAQLTELISKPWKGKRGPKRKEDRDDWIKERFLFVEASEPKVSRKDAIIIIANRFKLSSETAAKAYDKAM